MINWVYLLICLWVKVVLFGMCNIVICLFGEFVGLWNILNFMFFKIFVILINFNGLCKFGLFELKWFIVLCYVIIGNLFKFIFKWFNYKLWIIFFIMVCIFFVVKNEVFILIWVNLGWWLVCKFLLWKYFMIW